ncbi:MAG: 6-carboxytetrahydropterin synthase QueD [Coriobacteriales bacterium]|jgi:queuosine biosynthesis protein QueD|nr:6-carboxytetrahydropterin synthase QueD [Coriobacteriales bacterium]
MIAVEHAVLNTDGGSRGNPGPSGIGFTLCVDNGRELLTLTRGGAFIGVATNNVAEYRALIWGLENAAALSVQKLEICADSELLVKQLKGEYKVKNEGIKPLYRQAQQLLAGFPAYSIRHVYREDNSEADVLANEAMDQASEVGDAVVPYISNDLFGGMALEAAQPARSSPISTDTSTPTSSEGDRMSSTGTYTLTVKEHFDAAHALVGYPGQCRNLHGHTWDIEASVSGTELDEVGIVYDFKDLKSALLEILDAYDHHYLNEVPPFDTLNATAENLARVIYEQLAAKLPAGIKLEEIAVWESPIAKLTYRQ